MGSARAANVSWVGPNGSFWDLASNWNPGLPADGDAALLGAFSTIFQSGTLSLQSFSGTGTLTLSSGTLNASSASSTGGLVLGNGVLGGAGTVTAGTLNWSSGMMGDYYQPGGVTTVSGASTIDGTQSQYLYYGRTLNLSGNTSWTQGDGSVYIYSGGMGTSTLNIGAGTTFTDAGTTSGATRHLGQSWDGVINNAGTYNRNGAGTTAVQATFNNTGTVNVNAGTMQFIQGLAGSGNVSVASGASLALSGGTFDFNGGVLANAGTLRIDGGTVNLNIGVNYSGSGAVELYGGTLSTAGTFAPGSFSFSGGTALFGGPTNLSSLTMSSGTLGGTGTVTLGTLNWSSGMMGDYYQPGGVTTVSGASTIDGTQSQYLYYGRTLNLNGNTSWTQGDGSVYIYSGGMGTSTLNIGAGTTFTDAGTTSGATRHLGQSWDGVINNAGTYNRNGAGTTAVQATFNNTGTVNVNAGTMHLYALANFSGTTLTGGTYRVAGSSVLAIAGADIVTNAASLVLDGTGSQILDANTSADALANFATNTAAGSFTIRNGRNFASAGAFANAGTVHVGSNSTFTAGGAFGNQAGAQLQLAGGSFAGPSLGNMGLLTGFGSVTPAVANTGSVVATGGSLTLTGGVQGNTGTVTIDPSASLALGASSSAATLTHNGTLLALGPNNITVRQDYDNANFGAGNAFNRRAGIDGTGQVLASGTTQQTLSGTLVQNGTSAAATLALPNIRVGQGGVTTSFNINNVGTGGPSLRGALQNTGITDTALSGSGVTVQNWGAVAQGASSDAYTVTFNPLSGQALSGQTLQVVNNFDNVAGQTLTITGSAFNLASASAAAPNPVVFGNQRVGAASPTQVLTLTNTAVANGFSESLNATIASTGDASSSGSISLLPAGTSSSALQVGLDTASAGAKSGQATITLTSDGTGTSGFGALGIGMQVVNVSGNVYQLAAGALNTAPLNFGTVQVGQSVSQVLSISNSASGPAGYVEDLNAGFGAASGQGAAQISGSGSIAALAAGTTDDRAMTVSVNTGAAGTINGSILVNFHSAGSVGGASNGLAAVSVGSTGFGVSGVIQSQGQVIDQALPVLNTPSVNFGNLRIGSAAPSQLVSVTNQATGNAQAALNASIGAMGPVTAGGSFNLLDPGSTNGSSLQVGMNTSAAGAVNGSATIAFVSDASNVGNCAPNCQLTLASQDVVVSGAVYRMASPSITTGPIALAARVGGMSPTASIGVTNVSPDAYTESLNASIGAGPNAFTTSGAVTGLVAGASSAALGVALNTGTAGDFSGQVAVGFVSSGAGTTGAADAALASQNVDVSGKVYTPAVAQVNTPVLNFGVVHKGDMVAAQNVSVSNAAAVAGPNDTLVGSLSGASGPFTASGTLAGVAAQQTDGSSLSVTLNTAAAGIFNGSATATFASHNADMSDLALGTANIVLQAQVNNYAELGLQKSAGSGTLSHSGATYTVDFGSLLQGATDLDATLAVLNAAIGPADVLSGSFSIGSGAGFTLTGFDSFSDIATGSTFGGLNIVFDSAQLGDFTQTIVISGTGSNASGFSGALSDTTLVLRGSVVAVPEPGTYALMLGGLLGLWLLRRRQQGSRG